MKKLPTVGIIDTKTSNIKSVYYATSLQNVEVKYISSLEDPKLPPIAKPKKLFIFRLNFYIR